MTQSSSVRPGITLLEVLIAMAIFLIALGAISRLIDLGMENASDASYQSDAVRLAQSKMAEVEAGVLAPDSSSGGGFDEEPGWTWQLQSEQASIPNLFTITVTVNRDVGRKVIFKLSQMVMDARQMGKPGEIAKPTTSTTGTSP
jgi:general secretion pathway protein I